MKNSTLIDKIKFVVIVLLGLLLTTQCTVNNRKGAKRHKNLAYLYNPSSVHLHPNFQVFNFSEDSSLLLIKIPYKDFLIREVAAQPSYGMFAVKAYLYQSLVSGSLVDSISQKQRFYKDTLSSNLIIQLRIKTPNLKKTFLKLTLKDLYGNTQRSDYVEVDKTALIHHQNILLEDDKGENVWQQRLRSHTLYHIHRASNFSKPLYICWQKKYSKPASIPYSSLAIPFLEYAPDSILKIEGDSFVTREESMLFLTHDTLRFKGIQYLVLDNLYSVPHTPTQMLQPLQYLLSKSEYQSLISDKNPKYALDKFWLKVAGSERHAIEMIKVFYKRVSRANRYFTSYKQGWETDRGMMYIVFGAPTTVYKSETLERWIYGNINESTFVFDFEKSSLRPYINHSQLVRNKLYQTLWSQAIKSWRGGKIFAIAQ